VPDDTGAQSLLSLAVWDSDRPGFLYPDGDGQVCIHDIARGPLPDQPCSAPGDGGTEKAELHAVHCGGRLLVLTQLSDDVIRVLDTTSRRWAAVWLRDDSLVRVFALDAPGGDELLLVGVRQSRIVPWNALRRRFTEDGERPPAHRLRRRRRMPRRAPAPEPPVTHEHGMPLRVEYAALLPGGETYAAAGDTTLCVLGTRDDTMHRTIDLPSPCTALTTGPAGELIVGTRNGPILFDRW
jgi:hypothetical protein